MNAHPDLWSYDPAVRVRAAGDPALVGDLVARVSATAPMQPWPYGMPTSVNPFVVFLGPSPGNSPIAGDAAYVTREPQALPTAGVPYPGIYYRDPKRYFERIRELGTNIVRHHAPRISDQDAHALLGQLNLGTGAFGEAANAPLDPVYCRWVPDLLLDHLRPVYVVLLGLATILTGAVGRLFDPANRLNIDWKKPDLTFDFASYEAAHYRYRIWRRRATHGQPIHLVLWPQHPSRSPMTNAEHWRQSGVEFLAKLPESWR
jgi:hypothetical protein